MSRNNGMIGDSVGAETPNPIRDTGDGYIRPTSEPVLRRKEVHEQVERQQIEVANLEDATKCLAKKLDCVLSTGVTSDSPCPCQSKAVTPLASALEETAFRIVKMTQFLRSVIDRLEV